MLQFDTDYKRGACKEIIRRLTETNLEATSGYGEDEYCQRAEKAILKACGLQSGRVHFLVGGTQTNATVIDGLLSRCQGVLAAESAHINVHEAGAIEAAGHKVIVIESQEGKVSAESVEAYLEDFFRDETYPHMVSPSMLYISFPTETGSLYSLSELRSLREVCTKYRIPLYIDGARLGYGIMAEGNDVSLMDIASLADVFYIGGTKCGALFGEAVVVRNEDLLHGFFSLVKLHGALLAKGRLLGLQFETLFTDNLYFKLAKNATDLAMQLRRGLIAKGYEPYSNSTTNQQIFYLPNKKIDELKAKATFEIWGTRRENLTPVRFVTDWATSKEEVEELLSYL